MLKQQVAAPEETNLDLERGLEVAIKAREELIWMKRKGSCKVPGRTFNVIFNIVEQALLNALGSTKVVPKAQKDARQGQRLALALYPRRDGQC